MPAVKIKSEVLERFMEWAKAQLPKEALGLMLGEDVIDSFILMPGTIQGNGKVLYLYDALPQTIKYVGTIHSHPGTSGVPSAHDLKTFANLGAVHLIVFAPLAATSVLAYDSAGSELSIEIVNY